MNRFSYIALGIVLLLGIGTGCVSQETMTLMSYNVRMGCGFKGGFKLEKGSLGCLPKVARIIREVRPDWVAVQEIDRRTIRAGGIDQTQELAALCNMHGTFLPKIPYSGGEYGLAILSKEKPLDVSMIKMPGSSHTRGLMVAHFKKYIVACTHFPLTQDLREIAAQIVRLNLLDSRKPVFLAGDFNARPSEKTIEILKQSFAVLNDESVPTFPSDKPNRCIDYIFADKEHFSKIEIVERKVIAESDATDHAAVIVKVKLF